MLRKCLKIITLVKNLSKWRANRGAKNIVVNRFVASRSSNNNFRVLMLQSGMGANEPPEVFPIVIVEPLDGQGPGPDVANTGDAEHGLFNGADINRPARRHMILRLLLESEPFDEEPGGQ